MAIVPTAFLILSCARPENVAVELGISHYLGTSEVAESATEEGVTTWTFSDEGAARCMRGAPYKMSTRSAPSKDLVIFLQGGGACWEDFCFAVTAAPDGIASVDILNPNMEENPVAGWDTVYLPYCDGSLFIGDIEHDEDGDGEPDRFHRGLANLSAALDVSSQEFPDPKRVLFAGSSGGGFGAFLAAPLVRHVYPDAELILMLDSAVGVARGAADPTFITDVIKIWGAGAFLPEDCPGCIEDGHISPFIDWYLERDPRIRVGLFTSWYDAIIADVFLDVPLEDFQDSIEKETGRTHEAHPDRYRRFVINGQMHTTLLGDATGIIGTDMSALEYPDQMLANLGNLEIGGIPTTESESGVLFADWLGGLVQGDDALWLDTLDPVTPPPSD
jgi:hypothetical protein